VDSHEHHSATNVTHGIISTKYRSAACLQLLRAYLKHRVAQPAPSDIELGTKIFSFACLDDGSTGRNLSLVSKYVHQVSKPVKLQSIVLRGFRPAVGFLSLLEATLEHHRHVYHLFAYEHHEPASGMTTMLG
jgi:hypothetical protein